jgi:predicted anti-sigma-YlaC factor YlaD
MLGKFKCRKIRSLFADYIDGSLERKPKLLASFNEHIATCDECKNALKGYRAVLTALSAVASEGVRVPDGVCEETYRAVLSRIAQAVTWFLRPRYNSAVRGVLPKHGEV